MTLGADGIIRLDWGHSIAINGPLARKAMGAADELCRDTRRPILVDLSTIGSVDRSARAVFSELSKPSKIALLGTSAVDRVMASAILGHHQPPNPMKYFTNKAAALAWLKLGWDCR